MRSIKDNPNAYLIVDFIYDDKGLDVNATTNHSGEEGV
jgi:hypothetical protein